MCVVWNAAILPSSAGIVPPAAPFRRPALAWPAMTATGPLWLFSELERHDWWQALTQLERADGSRATEAYARLFSALLQAGHDSPAEALAAALLDTTLPAGPARLRSG